MKSSNKASKASRALWVCFILELLYIFFILLNYDIAWMNSEKFGTHAWILSNGNTWQAADFGRSLNIDIIEIDPHRLSRPLSNLLEVINAKFRANLWNFIPPHPSLSMLWPFFFIVLPICLYRFLKNVGCNANLALGGCMLYMSTLGFLGPIVMLFHPGKSLTNFGIIVTLWIASRICISKKPSISIYVGLIISMLATFLSDETGLFVYPMTFLLLLKYFKRLWIIYLIMPLLYFVSIRMVLPWLHETVRGHNVALHDFKGFPNLIEILKPNWEHVTTNARWLLGEHPGLHLNFQTLWESNKYLFVLHGLYLLALAVIAIMFVWSLLRKKSTFMLWGASALIVIYVFFFTFQLSTVAKVWGVWWYGTLYSLVFMIWFILAIKHIGEYFVQGWQPRFLTFFIILATAHTLIFCTYQADIFMAKAHHKIYTGEQIFSGEMKEFYRDFNLFDSMKRSHCKYMYVEQQWAIAKHKHIRQDAKDQGRCRELLEDDALYPVAVTYLSVEL